MLRVGILGTGGIASAHARYWPRGDRAQIVAIADADRARAEKFAAAIGLDHSAVCADLDELLTRAVDVVDCCTPPWLHQEQALQILAAGRHVVLEKPLAADAAGLDAMVAAELRTGRVVVPVLQNRLGIGPRQLRALYAAGLCGTFRHALIETSWRRTAEYYSVPWRGRFATELGGCLTGLAIHQLDVALEFAPAVTGAIAHRATLAHAIEVEDSAAAVVTCAGGAFLTVHASVHAHRETSRLRLVFAGVEVESSESAYAWAATPWRFTAADPAHQARIDAVLATIQPVATPHGADPLWSEAARIWADRCMGAGPIDSLTGARTDLASARAGLDALDRIYGRTT